MPDTSTPVNPPYSDGRFVPLTTVFNLRDLGGLPGLDGRKVSTGLVYRSDQFGNASATDIAHLATERRLRTVVDLRRAEEIAATGSFPTGNGTEVKHLELRHIAWERIERDLNDPDVTPFLIQRYTAMIECGAETIAAVLNLACDATPLVFHCMAGKDRTGIISAIMLRLLGVSDADIAADYALTAEGMQRYFNWCQLPPDDPQRGPQPLPEAMLGLLRNIDTYFGGTEAYARAIGFDRVAELRAQLLT